MDLKMNKILSLQRECIYKNILNDGLYQLSKKLNDLNFDNNKLNIFNGNIYLSEILTISNILEMCVFFENKCSTHAIHDNKYRKYIITTCGCKFDGIIYFDIQNNAHILIDNFALINEEYFQHDLFMLKIHGYLSIDINWINSDNLINDYILYYRSEMS